MDSNFIVLFLMQFSVYVTSFYTKLCYLKMHLTNFEVRKLPFVALSYILIEIITFSIINKEIYNILIQILLLLIISSTFCEKYGKRLIFSLTYTSVMVILELLVGYTLSIIDASSYNIVEFKLEFKFIGLVISTLIALCIVKILQQYKVSVNNNVRMGFFDVFKIVIIPIISINLTHILHTLSVASDQNLDLLVIFALFLLTTLNIYFYIILEKTKDYEKNNFEIKLLREQYNYYLEKQTSVEESYKTVKILKHNLKYHLMNFKDKLNNLTEENIMYLKDELNSLINESSDEVIVNYTDNKVINNILNSKIECINKMNIDLNVKVNVSNQYSINEGILYVVLGNILDNAIENYNNSKSKQKQLIVRIYEEYENLYIKISNPYAHRILVYDGLPITRKKDKSSHGIGILSIKNILEQNNGILQISTENNIFTIQIVIFESTNI